MGAELLRNSKLEIRNKLEIRTRGDSEFGLGNWSLFRISDFELRVCRFASPLACDFGTLLSPHSCKPSMPNRPLLKLLSPGKMWLDRRRSPGLNGDLESPHGS